MSTEVSQLEQKLADVIRPRNRVLTAFSGGIDSTLVAAMARRVLGRDHAPAVIGDSPSLPRRELEDARMIAADLDIELIETTPAEQDDELYLANAGDRCFHCKTHLYVAARAVADQRGIEHIANGANVDDLGDHRPGLDAAREAWVISPLVEAGMTKADVRALAEHLDLPNADKPAAACLASRIPYGTAVTPERLSMVERAERVLHELGFTGFRVRHHETVARIEVPREQMPRLLDPAISRQVVDALRRIGYTYVTLDLAGFQSGSGNLLLQVGNRVGRDDE